MRRFVSMLIVLGALASDRGARADAIVEPPPCPARPSDGASCRAFHRGAVCRYPRTGVICECRRIEVDERTRLLWYCGELGE